MKTYIIGIFLILAFIFGCKQKESNLPIEYVYYEFENFNASPEATLLLKKLKEAYDTSNFIITKDEQFVALNITQDINLDTLHEFHPKGHRIIPITENSIFSEGDEKLIIRNLDSDQNNIFGFEYKRFIYTADSNWALKYDLGIHPLQGVPSDSNKRMQFIINEIARASYK